MAFVLAPRQRFVSPTIFFFCGLVSTHQMCLESHFYLIEQLVKILTTVAFSLIINREGNALEGSPKNQVSSGFILAIILEP